MNNTNYSNLETKIGSHNVNETKKLIGNIIGLN